MTDGTPQTPTLPVPRQKGRYNMFDTPDGGVHISYTVEGSEEIQHIEVPGKLLNMAKMLESGDLNPLKAFSMLRKMGGQ